MPRPPSKPPGRRPADPAPPRTAGDAPRPGFGRTNRTGPPPRDDERTGGQRSVGRSPRAAPAAQDERPPRRFDEARGAAPRTRTAPGVERVRYHSAERVKSGSAERVKSESAERVRPTSAERVRPTSAERVRPTSAERVRPTKPERMKADDNAARPRPDRAERAAPAPFAERARSGAAAQRPRPDVSAERPRFRPTAERSRSDATAERPRFSPPDRPAADPATRWAPREAAAPRFEPRTRSQAPAERAPRATDRPFPATRAPRPAAPEPAAIPTPPNTYWLYGLHAVEAALRNTARRAHRLLLTADAEATLGARLPPEALTRGRLTPERADRQRFQTFLTEDAVHQGAAMLVEPLLNPVLEKIIAARPGPVVLLDQVTDPRNVGAILRSAAAFGAAAVVLQSRHAPPETGAMGRAASGALDLVPIVREVNLSRTIQLLQRLNFWVVGLAGDAPRTMAEAGLAARRIALVLGAEDAGLRRLQRETCDELLRLPMAEGVESLNVSAAAAVALYEVARR